MSFQKSMYLAPVIAAIGGLVIGAFLGAHLSWPPLLALSAIVGALTMFSYLRRHARPGLEIFIFLGIAFIGAAWMAYVSFNAPVS